MIIMIITKMSIKNLGKVFHNMKDVIRFAYMFFILLLTFPFFASSALAATPTPLSTTASTPVPSGQLTFTWSGLNWISNDGSTAGGASNICTKNNVWVDAQNRLHLKIAKSGNAFTCAEIETQSTVGYGSYTFNVASNPIVLANNVVAGMFYYKSDLNELDIEYSRWGDPDNNNLGEFSVQPGNSPPQFYINSPNTINKFVWSADGKVSFEVRDSSNNILSSWNYTGTHKTAPGGHLAINLWICTKCGSGLTVPADGSEQELILNSVQYIPTGQLKPAVTSVPTPAPSPTPYRRHSRIQQRHNRY